MKTVNSVCVLEQRSRSSKRDRSGKTERNDKLFQALVKIKKASSDSKLRARVHHW